VRDPSEPDNALRHMKMRGIGHDSGVYAMLFVLQLSVAFLGVVFLYALRIDRYFRPDFRTAKPQPGGAGVLRTVDERPALRYRVKPIIRDAEEFIPEAPLRN
jgi:hypothetical protein